MSRGGRAINSDGTPVVPNGAWTMMLEAAALLRKYAEIDRHVRKEFAHAENWPTYSDYDYTNNRGRAYALEEIMDMLPETKP